MLASAQTTGNSICFAFNGPLKIRRYTRLPTDYLDDDGTYTSCLMHTF